MLLLAIRKYLLRRYVEDVLMLTTARAQAGKCCLKLVICSLKCDVRKDT